MDAVQPAPGGAQGAYLAFAGAEDEMCGRWAAEENLRVNGHERARMRNPKQDYHLWNSPCWPTSAALRLSSIDSPPLLPSLLPCRSIPDPRLRLRRCLCRAIAPDYANRGLVASWNT